MHSDVQQISRECLWILSNVAAGTMEHVTRLFSINNFLGSIFNLCKDVNSRKRKVFLILDIIILGSILGFSKCFNERFFICI